ncbi:hypothetical protein [Gulosibacter molinativorax]|uniref:Uncharacterized protein n=1 Tax=Gulosibacter molinativorax TaxID=256821 RepID=A0ABT7C544_9MICO|nr:hypothetical protein [Gulosibacter molinativorax]MDJ1370308.1 hypothetical protein [Gulosibacter molinativorax]QUY61728.1 Hypotetical protein [Gulosibacter molinativorax]
MGIQERKAAIELLAQIIVDIDERLKRHTMAEEKGTPTTSTRLSHDLVVMRDRITMVTGELLEPATSAHISRVLDRITRPRYEDFPHHYKELDDLKKKLELIVSYLRVISNRKEFEGL